MSAKTYPVCEHPRETFVREERLSSYYCPECKARVCLDCHRYGTSDFLTPLVSWMTGTCDDCYRERDRRQKIRDDYWGEEERRTLQQRIWDEGFEAGWAAQDPDDRAPNPYTVPSATQTWLLEQHDWLREEVQP